MRRNAFPLLLALVGIACTSVSERHAATVVYESEIQDPARARQIALRYSAFVGETRVNTSNPFHISPCNEASDPKCSYRITQWLDHCVVASFVTERCEGAVCTHEFTAPQEILCE
jgi:hypothetical protein